jgi:hypothetical protein
MPDYEYEFEVTIVAVVRVRAESEGLARDCERATVGRSASCPSVIFLKAE